MLDFNYEQLIIYFSCQFLKANNAYLFALGVAKKSSILSK